MSSKIEVKKVETKRARKRFIKFPYELYKGNQYWVPPLLMDYKKMLTPNKHPYYEHGDVEFFMVTKDGELSGRCTAHTNTIHNEVHRDKVGFFGFFECIDDHDCANALFDAAGDWLKGKGMDTMRGPLSFSLNELAGLLIDAYDMPPVVEMPYNPPYYVGLIERYGFKQVKDLYAYRFFTDQEFPEKVYRVAEKVKEKEGVEFRHVNFRDWENELARVKKVYNTAWTYNWGFCPITEGEFQKMVRDFKPVAIPELVIFGFVKGEVVGISVTIPDINITIKEIKGRLLPFGFLKILFKGKKVKSVRVLIMGVIKEYQLRGLDAVFYAESLKAARNIGIEWGEMSWILDDNIQMKRLLDNIGGEIYKTYRVYDYPLK